MTGMFVVVEFNQASHQPREVWLADDRDDAESLKRGMEARTREVGRRERYQVFELVEVEEDEQ